MEINISNVIDIKNPSSTVKRYCEQYLVIDNPEYEKKLRMGKWLGNTPSHLYLYEVIGDHYILPYGCKNNLLALISSDDQEFTIVPSVQYKNDVHYKSRIELYDYQVNAVNAVLKAENGILVMPCGSGKTQVGLEVISRLGGRALWLTHTHDLLVQSKKRAEATLEIDGRFGVITAGKVDIGTHITFATVQTMSRLDLSKYKDCFDVVIVDEAQHCCGTPTRITQFYKVVSALSARYKIGLTATPSRSDGLERSMYALLGGRIYEVTKDMVKSTTCPIHVLQVKTGYNPDSYDVLDPDGTINYNLLVQDMINDKSRFDIVSNYINMNCRMYTIVLASRVEYLKMLQKSYRYKSICLSIMQSKQDRKDALRKLNDGDISCIFATYQLAKEGLDVPNLRYVVFATPEKNEITVTQSMGRVGRKAEGKEVGVVIDFVDDFGIYKRWSGVRNRIYRKNDAVII